MNIAIISGTPRKNGLTKVVAKQLAHKLKGTLVDTSVLELPLFNGEEEQGRHPSVQWLRRVAEEADAFIWVSPEYHNGMSGALKNVLEFLSSHHFHQKPTLLLAVSGGGKGGINALNQMRTVGRGLYADVVPEQLIFDPIDFRSGGLSEQKETKLDQLVRDFISNRCQESVSFSSM
ncbi:azobenzene reductase [Halobacillus karajensis]|uniref:NADPH-dependent FMN reductase n=1 Tax=Halobacillus karajensis TaxID=195088 RepID=UPI0008A76065|nr:NADPH-dependent FMN reductase [Halobacillus karajensis]SEI11757.1 azobenzene reductase [Halobacillus karajensis]